MECPVHNACIYCNDAACQPPIKQRVGTACAPARKDVTALGSFNVTPSSTTKATLGVPNAFLGSATEKDNCAPDA